MDLERELCTILDRATSEGACRRSDGLRIQAVVALLRRPPNKDVQSLRVMLSEVANLPRRPSVAEVCIRADLLPEKLLQSDATLARFPNDLRIHSLILSEDDEAAYYEGTWWDRFGKRLGEGARRAVAKQVSDAIGASGLAVSWQTVAILLGAPQRAIDDFRPVGVTVSSVDHAGARAWSEESKMKHRMNEILLKAYAGSKPLSILELCQGAGDGTRSYQRFGPVLACEAEESTFNEACRQVAHIGLSAENSQSSVLGSIVALGYDTPPFPAIMPRIATRANDLVKLALESKWRFSWIDIDTYGFVEASDIDFLRVLDCVSDEAIVAVSNGAWHQRRFMSNLDIETKLVDLVVKRSPVHASRDRILQRGLLYDHLLEIEAALRIEQAAEVGIELHPLVLYDGRSSNRGIQRLYFWCHRPGRRRSIGALRRMVRYRSDLTLHGLDIVHLTDDPSETKRILRISFEAASAKRSGAELLDSGVPAYLAKKIATMRGEA